MGWFWTGLCGIGLGFGTLIVSLKRTDWTAATGYFNGFIAIEWAPIGTFKSVAFNTSWLAYTINAVHRSERSHYWMPSGAMQIVPITIRQFRNLMLMNLFLLTWINRSVTLRGQEFEFKTILEEIRFRNWVWILMSNDGSIFIHLERKYGYNYLPPEMQSSIFVSGCWIRTGELSISSIRPAGSVHHAYRHTKKILFINESILKEWMNLPGQTGQQSSLVRIGFSHSGLMQSLSWHKTIPAWN